MFTTVSILFTNDIPAAAGFLFTAIFDLRQHFARKHVCEFLQTITVLFILLNFNSEVSIITDRCVSEAVVLYDVSHSCCSILLFHMSLVALAFFDLWQVVRLSCSCC